MGILYGGKVDRMVLGLNAHVSISGAEYSRTGLALLNVAGLLLPVLFLVVALAVYQAKIKSALYHFFYGVLWMAISGSLLAWVIIPIIALFGTPPQGDDVTKFMTNTGLNPMIMILAAILIVAGLIILALKKGLFTLPGFCALCYVPNLKKSPLQNSFQDPRHRTVACRYPGRVSHKPHSPFWKRDSQ